MVMMRTILSVISLLPRLRPTVAFFHSIAGIQCRPLGCLGMTPNSYEWRGMKTPRQAWSFGPFRSSSALYSWESDVEVVPEDDILGVGDFDESSIESSSDENADSSMLQEYELWSRAVDKTLASLRKKQASLQNELDKAEKIEATVNRAQLLTSYLYLFTPGVGSATVQDWEQEGKEVELILDPKYDSASAEADALFTQVRKLKRGSEVVGDLLQQTSSSMESLEEIRVDLNSAISEDGLNVDEGILRLVQDRLLRGSRSTGFEAPKEDLAEKASSGRPNSAKSRKRKPTVGTPASNIRKLQSPSGCTILVGRNRRGNEHLSCTVARGDDIWMHARGSPGAHVVVMQRRGGPRATDACIQLAADLAAFYSDSRNERKADVTAAEPKHVVKPPGAPLGAVKLREEWKVFQGVPDNVPDELKEAREASGLQDAYRAADKAKLRRRNRQHAEDSRAKQKAKRRKEK